MAATVLGGLGKRLLGGLLHPQLHWRYAFVAAAAVIAAAAIGAFFGLPKSAAEARTSAGAAGFVQLLRHWPLLRIYFCAAGAFAVFSSLFNFLPFRLAAAPFSLSTQWPEAARAE